MNRIHILDVNNNIKAFFPSKLGRLDMKPNTNIRKPKRGEKSKTKNK
jgi:hypothetical protein